MQVLKLGGSSVAHAENIKKVTAIIKNKKAGTKTVVFIRIMEIFHQQIDELKKTLNGYTISDDDTKATLISVFKEHHYLLDPHGAFAYTALQQYQARHPNTKGVILETAHPVKFYDVIEPLINLTVPVPEVVAEQIKKEKVSTKINASIKDLKEFLLR